MKERPIIFSGAMVRALMAGTKTQTRRVVKPQPPEGTQEVSAWHHPADQDGRGPRFWSWSDDPERPHGFFIDGKWCQASPYGAPGDRLWVREAHWWFKDQHDPVTGYYPPALTIEDVEYRADEGRWRPWRSPIHMPRWASRITLEVSGVRVERLHDISEADCRAEGCAGGHGSIPGYAYSAIPREHYTWLWGQINGAGSWEANPWVWCVEFRRLA